MSDELSFDMDAVTPRMLIDFKEKTGVALMSLANEGGEFDLATMNEELIAGFVWLAMRMSGNPGATWDDALDTPLVSLDFAGPSEASDPTPAS